MDDPELSKSMTYDSIRSKLPTVKLFPKIARFGLIILSLSYAIGHIWFIFIKIGEQVHDKEDDPGKKFFTTAFNLEDNTDSRNSILVMYFAMTTICSIGWGDFTP